MDSIGYVLFSVSKTSESEEVKRIFCNGSPHVVVVVVLNGKGIVVFMQGRHQVAASMCVTHVRRMRLVVDFIVEEEINVYS